MKNSDISIEKGVFGKLEDGREIPSFSLKNAAGVRAKIISYGAALAELWAPGRDGEVVDVVLGFDALEGYTGRHPHFGGIIGRVANRIAAGKFVLDGRQYALALNDGPNTLHGGRVGFDHRVWKPEVLREEGCVRLSYFSPNGEEGFPGNLSVAVEYRLTARNELKFLYRAATDKPTILNLTNHSYFNLSGGGDVLDHSLEINANSYTPVDTTNIPTGEIKSVADTPFDFTKQTKIGARSTPVHPRAGAYDCNYVVNGTPGALRFAARVTDPGSGRAMEVWTTEPGIQLYTAIWLDGSITGKGGVAYQQFGAVCLETQHFPNAINIPSFPSTVLRPGAVFQSETIYKISVV